MPEDTTRITVARCPVCEQLEWFYPEEGLPECDHGLLFGTGPSGGGEADMEAVEFVRADVHAEVERERDELRRAGQALRCACVEANSPVVPAAVADAIGRVTDLAHQEVAGPERADVHEQALAILRELVKGWMRKGALVKMAREFLEAHDA